MLYSNYYQFLGFILTVVGVCWCANSGEKQESGCLKATKEYPNQYVNFYLYTRANRDNPYKFSGEDESLKNAQFVANAPIKFLVHGYSGSMDSSPNDPVRPTYLDNFDYNIISVDYSQLVADGCYVQSIKNLEAVAFCIAKFTEQLLKVRADFKLDNFHFIGHSLGAHAIAQVKNSLTSGTIQRLTGLDPASPGLYKSVEGDDFLLTKDDANFVDILHTNAGFLGRAAATGHIDFYANNGVSQPGCGIVDPNCSHKRSAALYAESISTKAGFWAYPCGSISDYEKNTCPTPEEDKLVLMGENVPRNARGVYFFETNDAPPYALGKTPFE